MPKHRLEHIAPGPRAAMAWRRVFPGRADQVPHARNFATVLFTDTDLADDVGFIVTELVTNAVRHTRSGEHKGSFMVELVLDQMASVSVTDLGGAGYPIIRRDRLDGSLAQGGRGLLAISQLANAVGVHGSPEIGHTVWADIECVPKGWVGSPSLTMVPAARKRDQPAAIRLVPHSG